MNIDIETPFAHVLNTNYALSSAEQRSIWSLIESPEKQVRRLDEEISRLQAKRQTLKQFVDLHRVLLSPSRRVPTDIWRLIFIECLPNNLYGLCTRTTKDAPLLLTAVCRSWREIALSTPNLWTSIHIYLPAPPVTMPDKDYIAKLRGRKKGLKAWLDRSGSLPLTISLGAEQWMYRPPTSAFENGSSTASEEAWNVQRIEFTELLAQYSHRWGTVAFSFGAEFLDLTLFERIPSSSLTSLESLYSFVPGLFQRTEQPTYFNGGDHDRLSSLFAVANLLTRSHCLQRLGLDCSQIASAPFSLSTPWHHLTELSITSPRMDSSLHPSQLMQTLAAKCHSLNALDITFSTGNFAEIAASTQPIQWFSLQKLRIVFRTGIFQPTVFRMDGSTVVPQVIPESNGAFLPGVIQTFDSVTLPSLKRLSVSFHSGMSGRSIGFAEVPFENLLRRSQCPLTHFEMFSPRIIAAEKIINVLQQLETLEWINLGYSFLREDKRNVPWELSPELRDNEDLLARKRNWLDQILQEVSPSGLNVESQAADASTSLLCPRLEELNIGGCDPEYADVLLDFATKTRGTNLKMIRVDLGRFLQGDVWKIFDSLRVQRQDSEGMRIVRDMGGLTLDWRWDEQANPEPVFEPGTLGMPNDDIGWGRSSMG
ncbi:hypothetical protein PM082_011616 [Marasmius tenuissimus]|nr:hypothetical protein PM082_011616 [Marasmius tenuissimus]